MLGSRTSYDKDSSYYPTAADMLSQGGKDLNLKKRSIGNA